MNGAIKVQTLLFIRESTTDKQHATRTWPFATHERPKRVWTLIGQCDENKPPSLPYTPKHLDNAFLEDYIHDWDLRDRVGSEEKVFHYYSRVSDGSVWLLLEWD